MKHFTMAELTNSDTARALHIDNTPDATSADNLHTLVEMVLDPLRDAYGKPIYVNSGYRSPKLNKTIGGANRSQHMTGEAADITTGTKEGNRRLFAYIRDNLPFDQLIDEYGYSWVHVSYKRKGRNRREVIHKR